MKSLAGVDRIARERLRQLNEEHWTPEHDDAHRDGELLVAAICYAAYVGQRAHLFLSGPLSTPLAWPWDEASWKPKDDPIRNLEIAGALIAAEIDRLRRRE